MSAMTKSMHPSVHEMSQLRGLAVYTISRHRDREMYDRFGAYLINGILAIDLLLEDFDAQCEHWEAAFVLQMAAWRRSTVDCVGELGVAA